MSDLSNKSGISGVRRFFESWLPSGSPEVRLFLLLMAIGLTIRVLIMPFFGHIDFFSEHRRIHGLHEHGGWYPGSRFVTTTVERLNYAVVAPLLPEANSMFDVVDLKQTTASHLDVLRLCSPRHSDAGGFPSEDSLSALRFGDGVHDLPNAWAGQGRCAGCGDVVVQSDHAFRFLYLWTV